MFNSFIWIHYFQPAISSLVITAGKLYFYNLLKVSCVILRQDTGTAAAEQAYYVKDRDAVWFQIFPCIDHK